MEELEYKLVDMLNMNNTSEIRGWMVLNITKSLKEEPYDEWWTDSSLES